MYLFGNATNMVVNSNTVHYMHTEIIICEYDMSPEMQITYHTPTIWLISNQLMWEKTAQKQKFEISHVLAINSNIKCTFCSHINTHT